MISITDLSFRYPDGAQALDGVNLSVRTGETVGIIGPNGAGKSTLLMHLNGTLLSKTGSVTIDGIKIDGGNLKAVRRKVGMVFQDPDDQLFMPAVFDDIAFGLLNLGLKEDAVKDKVDAILKRFNMSGYADKMPHHLSLGEKKKIALAGILVLEPAILVFDEPTANLDPHSRREFVDMLQNIQVTKVIASHNLEMIGEITERTVIINKGRIVADDVTAVVLRNTELLEANKLV